jgi:hypothetical protein
LNAFNKSTPEARNEVAHELLTKRPSESAYQAALGQVKEAAERMARVERDRNREDMGAYFEELEKIWLTLIWRLDNQSPDSSTPSD